MMQDEAKYIRKTIQVDLDVENEVQEMADATHRSFSFVCNELLRIALKEKKRNRKGAKKDDS